jgi:hypothetical protein
MSQILRLNVFKRKSGVELLSAGDEQLVTCAPIVYLEASVSGDLLGHNFEWVQISGTPTVTLMPGGNPLQAYYVVENVGSDKTFRFYIDRNTQIQQYADVIVRTTPVDKLASLEHGAINNVTALPAGAYSSTIWLDGDFTFDALPFNSSGQVITQTAIKWDAPLFTQAPASNERTNYMAAYYGSVLEEWNGVNWVTLVDKSVTDVRQYMLDSDKRVRQGNKYFFSNVGWVTAYNQWIDVAASTSGNFVRGKEVLALTEHGVIGNQSTVVRIIYSLLLYPVSDNLTYVEHGAVNNLATVVRTVYALQEIPAADSFTFIEPGAIPITYTLTRSSGSVGVIGG